MSFSEVAIAIGLLTPLILGILAFVEKLLSRKTKSPDKDEEPKVVQGMPVAVDSFADQLIAELRRDIAEGEADKVRMQHTIDVLTAQIEIYKKGGT